MFPIKLTHINAKNAILRLVIKPIISLQLLKDVVDLYYLSIANSKYIGEFNEFMH